MDSVHFYDNNFFVKKNTRANLPSVIMPLGIKWWCEARVDALTRFSDDTWRTAEASRMDDGVLRRESGPTKC
jgi:hypothetical protein